jgi:hypothetical protein
VQPLRAAFLDVVHGGARRGEASRPAPGDTGRDDACAYRPGARGRRDNRPGGCHRGSASHEGRAGSSARRGNTSRANSSPGNCSGANCSRVHSSREDSMTSPKTKVLPSGDMLRRLFSPDEEDDDIDDDLEEDDDDLDEDDDEEEEEEGWQVRLT